ncbi:MAG: tape measure protein, partial [Rhodocyclaceae bacterium]|nr:tape measure protein [Rhodocyclaceae bacterium]
MSHDHVLSITVRAEVDEARRAFGSAIDALREMGVNTSALTDAFDTLHEALRDNQSQLKLIEIWKQLKREQQDFSKASLDAAKSADAYAKVCRDLESVRAQMSHLGTDVSALAQEHIRLKRAAAGIGDEFQAIAARANGLREASAHARTLAAELEQSRQEAMRLREAQTAAPSTGIEEQTLRLREQLNVLSGVRQSWKEATRSQIEGLQSSLDKLNNAARAVAQWREAAGDVRRLASALSNARERGEALARQMRAAGADLSRDAGFARVRGTIKQLESALALARERVKSLTPEMARLGINTDRLGQSNAQLAARARAVNTVYTELSAKLKFARQSMSEMGRQANTVQGAMQGITTSAATLHGALREIASGLAIGWSFRGAMEAADAYKNLTAQINLVNAAAPQMKVTMQQVTELAKTNHASLQDTVQLMMAVGQQSKELGISARDLGDIVQVIQQAGALGGQSADSTAAAVRQLIQALQSGVLRGEELNSVLEQAPRLARAIADGLGEPVSALRKLAQEGTLTSDEVLRALLQQKQQIEREFAELPVTADKAMQDVRTAFTLSIGELDKDLGLSDLWVSGLKMLERNMGAVVA